MEGLCLFNFLGGLIKISFEGLRMQPEFALLVTEFTRLHNFWSLVFRLELDKFRIDGAQFSRPRGEIEDISL